MKNEAVPFSSPEPHGLFLPPFFDSLLLDANSPFPLLLSTLPQLYVSTELVYDFDRRTFFHPLKPKLFFFRLFPLDVAPIQA